MPGKFFKLILTSFFHSLGRLKGKLGGVSSKPATAKTADQFCFDIYLRSSKSLVLHGNVWTV